MPDPRPLSDADRADLVAYLDGELDAAGQRRVESRLNADPHARAEADSLKRAWEMLDYLPRPEPAPEFTTRTLARVSAISPAVTPAVRSEAPAVVRPRRWLFAAAWAAGLVAALAGGYGLAPPTNRPPPADLDPDADPLMAAEPRLIEHLPLYLAAENMTYLNELDESDLFADDGSGR
jgi:anti-sigma factor RsiW